MIQDLDPDILMFGHFGAVETGDKLETYTEILPEWVAEVERKREELDDDEAVIDYFVERADTDTCGERKGRAEMRRTSAASSWRSITVRYSQTSVA